MLELVLAGMHVQEEAGDHFPIVEHVEDFNRFVPALDRLIPSKFNAILLRGDAHYAVAHLGVSKIGANQLRVEIVVNALDALDVVAAFVLKKLRCIGMLLLLLS